MAALLGVGPDALVAHDHVHGLIGVHTVTGGEEVQHHLGSGGCPDLKGGGVALDDSAQIVAVIVVVIGKILAVENFHRDHGLFAEAFHHDPVIAGQVQSAFHLDVAGGSLLAQGGDAGNGHFLVALVNLHLRKAGDGGFGADPVLDLICVCHRGHGEFLSHIQSFSSVVTDVLVGIAGLQINKGFPAVNFRKAVGLIVLGGAAPGGSAGVRAVLADDKANFFNALRDIDNDLAAVFTFMEQIALAVLIGEPDPHIAVFIAIGIGPIEGDLIVAIGNGLGIFLCGRFGGGFRGCYGGCLGSLHRLGFLAAGGKAQHHCRNQRQGKDTQHAFHGFSPSYLFRLVLTVISKI